jgi:hypothetical protein
VLQGVADRAVHLQGDPGRPEAASAQATFAAETSLAVVASPSARAARPADEPPEVVDTLLAWPRQADWM